jgi:hypothetical protein
MNKKWLSGVAIASVLFLAGCTNRIGDFTIVSTKNFQRNMAYKNMGRKTGEDKIFMFGIPNLKNAVDKCIEQAPGGGYLTNAVINYTVMIFNLGTGYEVTGDVYAEANHADLHDPKVELFTLQEVNGQAVLVSSRTGEVKKIEHF